jgi:hypothetical protein
LFRQKKIEKNEMSGTCSTYGEGSGAYMILVGKPEGKIPLGKRRLRWEHLIKMDLQEVGFVGMNWIDLAGDRNRWRVLVNAVIEVSCSIKCGEFLDWLRTG